MKFLTVQSVFFWLAAGLVCVSASPAHATTPVPGYNPTWQVTQYPGLPGQWIHGASFNGFGTRDYYLYYPSHRPNGPIPLVVMLHGCEQTPEELAIGSGLNSIAEKYGFAVLYPNQSSVYNEYSCWNWFLPMNHYRFSGEPSIVVEMVVDVGASIALDHAHIFVGGLSAGAAMASNMIACYSDLFSGAAIFAGMEYNAANTPQEGMDVLKIPPTQDINQSGRDAAACTGFGGHVPALVVIHGTNDTIVNPLNSQRLVAQMSKMSDMLDDGVDNGSQNLTLIKTHMDQVPNGYAYRSDIYGGKGKPHILNVTVQGMGHAWSGARTTGLYLDPKGPDAGELMWLFLSQFAGT